MTENIILYSTGCPRCAILKKKLAEKGIDYTENNSIDEMLALGIMTVPVLAVGEEMKSFTEAVAWLRNQ